MRTIIPAVFRGDALAFKELASPVAILRELPSERVLWLRRSPVPTDGGAALLPSCAD
jgi:hypothetical protein